VDPKSGAGDLVACHVCHNWSVDGQQQASDLVAIRQFGNLSEALFAKGCLESAGIECFLADANMAWMDSPLVRGMRLQVNQDDAAIAIELLDSPAIDDSSV
jgi:hypothetical protein